MVWGPARTCSGWDSDPPSTLPTSLGPSGGGRVVVFGGCPAPETSFRCGTSPAPSFALVLGTPFLSGKLLRENFSPNIPLKTGENLTSNFISICITTITYSNSEIIKIRIRGILRD